MPTEFSPTMRKRRLGQELRRLREAAGVAAEQSAAELDCSLAKIRHIEGGRNAPSRLELAALIQLYGADGETHQALEDIRKEASKPGWWSTYRLPPWFQAYVGAETEARTVRNFELELIPGLLQTESYARALHQIAGYGADTDRQVALRMKRQQRLFDDDNPLSSHSIISEGALRRLNGLDFAHEQINHLIRLCERPNISINILPFSTGLHLSLPGGFRILDFAPDVSAPVIYLEYTVGGELIDDQKTVQLVNKNFHHLKAEAMTEEESLQYLQRWK